MSLDAKSSSLPMNSLDFQDWELLPNNGFLDDGGSKNQSDNTTTTAFKSYFFSPEMPTQLAHEPTSPRLQGQEDVAHHPVPEMSRGEFHFEEKGKPSGKAAEAAGMEESRDIFNIWKLSLFGFAATGVCIIISWGTSNKQQNQKHHRRT